MYYLKKILIPLLIYFSASSNAGVNGTTIHSRANCGNNESITWYLWNAFDWQVVSFHNYNINSPSQGYHVVDTGHLFTWRAAAVHWGESAPGGSYVVNGWHYYWDRGRRVLDGTTSASNCNIYDGWWDYN